MVSRKGQIIMSISRNEQSKTAALYARVSTPEQARDGYSIDAQIHQLSEVASRRGYNNILIYTDAGISGRDIKGRPSMQIMMEDAKKNRFDCVFVWSLSRIARSVPDMYRIMDLFQSKNISLVSCTESFDTSTPVGRAIVGILSVFAQMEREVTGERVQAAMYERASQGKPTASCVLGYDRVPDTGLIVNTKEAYIVQFIFDAYERLQNLSAVARLCDMRQYRGKRGRKMKAEHIKVILSRPVYAGKVVFNTHVFQGNQQPIILQSQYDRVQLLLRKNGYKKKECDPPCQSRAT